MFEITVSTGLVPSGGSEANPSYASPLASGGLRTIFGWFLGLQSHHPGPHLHLCMTFSLCACPSLCPDSSPPFKDVIHIGLGPTLTTSSSTMIPCPVKVTFSWYWVLGLQYMNWREDTIQSITHSTTTLEKGLGISTKIKLRTCTTTWKFHS